MRFDKSPWYDEKVYEILKRYKSAWVIADSPKYPKAETVISDFVYVRMHGSKILPDSNYRELLRGNLEAYIYFNNDFRGYAIENAKRLLRLLDNN